MRKPDHYHDGMTAVSPHISANSAGLTWLEQYRSQPKDPHAHERCVLGMPWRCPFGAAFPCMRARPDRKLLARIGMVVYIPHREPVGQMSLFAPGITHKTVWRHYRTGEVGPDYPPPQHVMTVCKQMALATVRWLENDQGWQPPDWKIVPLDNDEGWKAQMVKRHGLKPCIFDEL